MVPTTPLYLCTRENSSVDLLARLLSWRKTWTTRSNLLKVLRLKPLITIHVEYYTNVPGSQIVQELGASS